MKILGQYFPSFQIREGTKIYFRKLNEFDVVPLVDFYYRLSPETKYFRFHSHTQNLPEGRVYAYAETLCRIEGKGLAIVAYTYENGIETFVGVVRYMQGEQDKITEAEWAIVLQDSIQRRGVGSYLLQWLLKEAKRLGLQRLYGTILPANTATIELVKKVAPNKYHFQHADGALEVDIFL